MLRDFKKKYGQQIINYITPRVFRDSGLNTLVCLGLGDNFDAWAEEDWGGAECLGTSRKQYLQEIISYITSRAFGDWGLIALDCLGLVNGWGEPWRG